MKEENFYFKRILYLYQVVSILIKFSIFLYAIKIIMFNNVNDVNDNVNLINGQLIWKNYGRIKHL